MRERLLTDLRALLRHDDPIALMNALQLRGLVSDCAVYLDDVPDCDLLAAKVKLERMK